MSKQQTFVVTMTETVQYRAEFTREQVVAALFLDGKTWTLAELLQLSDAELAATFQEALRDGDVWEQVSSTIERHGDIASTVFEVTP